VNDTFVKFCSNIHLTIVKITHENCCACPPPFIPRPFYTTVDEDFPVVCPPSTPSTPLGCATLTPAPAPSPMMAPAPSFVTTFVHAGAAWEEADVRCFFAGWALPPLASAGTLRPPAPLPPLPPFTPSPPQSVQRERIRPCTHRAEPLHSLHVLRNRLCAQIDAPPHSRQWHLRRLCTQKDEPLHSRHWDLCVPCLQRDAPPHSLQWLLRRLCTQKDDPPQSRHWLRTGGGGVRGAREGGGEGGWRVEMGG
jgi:hypothetical protein